MPFIGLGVASRLGGTSSWRCCAGLLECDGRASLFSALADLLTVLCWAGRVGAPSWLLEVLMLPAASLVASPAGLLAGFQGPGTPRRRQLGFCPCFKRPRLRGPEAATREAPPKEAQWSWAEQAQVSRPGLELAAARHRGGSPRALRRSPRAAEPPTPEHRQEPAIRLPRAAPWTCEHAREVRSTWKSPLCVRRMPARWPGALPRLVGASPPRLFAAAAAVPAAFALHALRFNELGDGEHAAAGAPARPGGGSAAGAPWAVAWKVLVMDTQSRHVLSHLFPAAELRRLGATLHLALDSAREPVPGVPAVYVAEVRCRTCQAWSRPLLAPCPPPPCIPPGCRLPAPGLAGIACTLSPVYLRVRHLEGRPAGAARSWRQKPLPRPQPPRSQPCKAAPTGCPLDPLRHPTAASLLARRLCPRFPPLCRPSAAHARGVRSHRLRLRARSLLRRPRQPDGGAHSRTDRLSCQGGRGGWWRGPARRPSQPPAAVPVPGTSHPLSGHAAGDSHTLGSRARGRRCHRRCADSHR